MERTSRHSAGSTARGAVVLGALGVVFGDLGTSPLYTMQTAFSPNDPHPVAVSTESIFGIVSMIFWAITIVVTVTYVLLVMRADNDGEGGIMALITLIRTSVMRGSSRTRAALVALGLFGAALFLGDSMITPAISVLSAVGGLEVASPSLEHLIVPITAAIIIALFMLQRLGSGSVGRLFGPVMVVWFTVIAAIGVSGIVDHPEILKALSPSYAVTFFFDHFTTSFFALGAVVLAVTGAEALYADMGHFGRGPITRAWVFLVFPALILSYMGQGALLLGDPSASAGNPFFLLAPDWAQWPMVFLATAATVIASQAVITGAFSVAHQASQLGYLPRLRVVRTSAEEAGQIYVPWINWLLLVSVLALVFAFQSSTKLAFAYGMAVTGTITITTLLFFYLAREQWRWRWWAVAGGAGFLLTIDLFFFAANATKLFHGAWLPILIAASVYTVLVTWQRGRELVSARRMKAEGSLREFIDALHDHTFPVERVPGTGVFLNRTMETAPLAMRATVDHLRALHEHVVILSIDVGNVPHVPPEGRLKVDDLGYRDDGITHAAAHFGYMDALDVPSVVRALEETEVECPVEADSASYFVSKIELELSDAPGLSRWRKHLFIATSRITADAADYFHLPREQTVIVGSQIEV